MFEDIKTPEELFAIIDDYNWDDGFDIPYAAMNSAMCTLDVARLLFWRGDGYGYLFLTSEESDVSSPEWLRFIGKLYRRIVSGSFESGSLDYHEPLNKVSCYRLRKKLGENEANLLGIPIVYNMTQQ